MAGFFYYNMILCLEQNPHTMKLAMAFVVVFLFSANNTCASDTLNFWTVRLDGKMIAKTTEFAILYEAPMQFSIASVQDWICSKTFAG